MIESLFMAVHFLIYLGLVCSLLGMWKGMAFILVHQTLFGLYLGAVFAPNHTGMLVLKGHGHLDRLRQQVLTARNVRSHPSTDSWFGGLNYQIEHHLFPHMARNKLNAAQATVKGFCLRVRSPIVRPTYSRPIEKPCDISTTSASDDDMVIAGAGLGGW